MDNKTITIGQLIENWGNAFPNYSLRVEDLKKSNVLMGALFQVFERLDIDLDAVLAPPPEEERTMNISFYWDLIPVINTTRVVNHLILLLPQYNISNTITQLLQPSTNTSSSMILLLFNLMLFRDERLASIAPYEDELFSKTDKVKALTDKRNNLLESVNEQLANRAERSGRLKKIDHDVRQYEEELKQEKEALDKDKQELEATQKECRQVFLQCEHKRAVRDALIAEVDKKRAQRVYDAHDIKAQREQAAQNVQDAEEKLNILQEKLKQKEHSLKNLQSIKPNLEIANNLLYDIKKQALSLRDYESGESESKEGEQERLSAELSELSAQFAELSGARVEAARKRQEASLARQQQRTAAQSHLHEAKEKDKLCTEKVKKAAQKVIEIQQSTVQYEKDKAANLEELTTIKENFANELNAINEIVLKKATESWERIEKKIKKR